jgi:6-phosphogluconolactonase
MERKFAICVRVSLVLAVCLASFLLLSPAAARGQKEDVGAVFTMTNETGGNSVLMFSRSARGALTSRGSFATGGLGTGGMEPDFGLANAGALALNNDNHLLFAVNPGSDDVSVFAIGKNGLTLIDRVASGGHMPISLTVNKDLLYVLNAGGSMLSPDNISGFTIGTNGTLSPIADSTRPLSGDVTGPAQIKFSPDGGVLVVTERVANNIDTYTIGRDGRATGPRVFPSDAVAPFGMDFGLRNQLFIADNFNDAAGAGALSSYRVTKSGGLQLVSSAVPNFETGACWVAVGNDSRYAYVANTGANTISVYGIAPQSGSVDFRAVYPSLYAPTDMDFSRDGQYLYALDPDQFAAGSPGITAYRVDHQDGSLAGIPGVSGLSVSVDGLIAY